MRFRSRAAFLPERDRRALVRGAIVIVPALIIRFAFVPFSASWVQREEQISAEVALFERESRAIAETDENERIRRVTAGQLQVGYRRLYISDQPNLATAGALAYIDSIAQESRVEVLQSIGSQVLPEANLTSVTIEFAGSSDFEGFLAFLTKLESGPMLARIPSFTVESKTERDEPSDVQTLAFKAAIRMYFAPQNSTK